MKIVFSIFVFLFSLFSSCSFYDAQVDSYSAEKNKSSLYVHDESEWTFIVYMAADNNLDSYALDDIREMEEASVNRKSVKTLVLLDRSQNTSEAWTETKLFEVSDRSSFEIDCPQLGLECGQSVELNMAQSENLSGLLKFTREYYPARHYALLIWGHGTGFRSTNDNIGKSGARAVAVDDTSGGDSMSKGELRKAISSGMGGQMLDLIAFDTCYSAEMEEVYELKNCAEYFAGNTGGQSLSGWNYKEWMSKSFENYNSGQEIAALLMKQYEDIEDCEKFSIVNLSAVSALFSALDSFALQTADLLDSQTKAEKAKEMLLSPAAVKRFQVFDDTGKSSPLYLDIESFVNRLVEYDSSLLIAGQRVKDSLYRAVIKNSNDSYPLGLYFCNVDFTDTVDEEFSPYCIQGSSADSFSLFVRDSKGYVLTKIKKGTLMDKIFSNYQW